jgi:hypothetical protein
MDGKAKLVLGLHLAVGGLFVALGVLGLVNGVGLAAAGFRFLLGGLVVGLGVSLVRLL